MFDYVPICKFNQNDELLVGSQDLKCLCKHSFKEHHPVTRKCQRAGCKNCSTSFTSKHGCACPLIYDDHKTVFESREEREAQGRPVDPKWMQEQNVSVKKLILQMVAGMGGLSQGFMDLVEGEDRAQMMSPNAIMGNLEHGNMLMGPNMRPAITSGQQQ